MKCENCKQNLDDRLAKIWKDKCLCLRCWKLYSSLSINNRDIALLSSRFKEVEEEYFELRKKLSTLINEGRRMLLEVESLAVPTRIKRVAESNDKWDIDSLLEKIGNQLTKTQIETLRDMVPLKK